MSSGRTTRGIVVALLGLVVVLTWWATTRSARVQRWKQSNDAVRLEVLAPGAVVGVVSTGAGAALLATRKTGAQLFAAVGLLAGGLIFLGMCAYAIWWWHSGGRRPDTSTN